jgi:hypothetical protein
MGRTGQTFRKVASALLFALPLLATNAWSHEENEPRETRDREAREDRSGRQTDDRGDRETRVDNSGRGSDSSGSGSGSGSGDRREERHDRDNSGRGAAARFEVERDRAGHERVRREVLMVGDRASIDTVRNAGFAIIAERPLAAFNETLARIQVRPGRSVEQVISELQALAPLASIAPDHLFRPSAETSEPAAPSPPPPAGEGQRGGQMPSGHVGVIDTGADTSWPALTRSIVQTEAFADGGYTSRPHGTLVSEIVARSGPQLTVADVFGLDADNRLIAPAAAIASALDWLVGNRVRVINISIEGPDNLVLAHIIKRALAADVAIVAAAGNGGPAAAPAFPAAYPGVIAVTAVDEKGQVYRRANRGDYIAFAARGVHVASDYESSSSKTAKTISGTSFASPVVAAAIARRLDGSSELQSVIASLKNEARDLGAPGRDSTYGWGELESPSALTASSR